MRSRRRAGDYWRYELSFDCVLWGGYGHGNVGDELALAVALSDAQAEFGDSIAVLTPDPEYTRMLFPDVTAIPCWLRRPSRRARWLRGAYDSPAVGAPKSLRADGSAWTETVRNAKVLWLAGGGYLTDLFRVEPYLAPLRAANAASVSVRTAPLGLGPFRSKKTALAVAEALRAAKVQVRDAASLEFCRAHGIAAELRPDAGFRLREILPQLGRPAPARRVLADPARRAIIGICACRQHGAERRAREADRWWVDLLRMLRRKDESRVRGFCFHADLREDYAYLCEIFSRAGYDPAPVRFPHGNFRNAIRELADFDAIATARFHAAAVAATFFIPCMAVGTGPYYQAKMASAAANAGSDFWLSDATKPDPSEAAGILVSACRAAGDVASAQGTGPHDAE